MRGIGPDAEIIAARSIARRAHRKKKRPQGWALSEKLATTGEDGRLIKTRSKMVGPSPFHG
jgi:hypothetical protein